MVCPPVQEANARAVARLCEEMIHELKLKLNLMDQLLVQTFEPLYRSLNFTSFVYHRFVNRLARQEHLLDIGRIIWAYKCCFTGRRKHVPVADRPC